MFSQFFLEKNTNRRTFPEMLSNRRDMLSIRQHFRKCCRIDENCVESRNVVESWRNVVESTKIPEMLSNRREMLSSRRHFVSSWEKGTSCRTDKNVGESTISSRNCRIDEKCCRVDVIFNFHGKNKKLLMLSSRRHFQCSTGKGKTCQIDEKCCRVDEIFGNVVEPARNVVELTTLQPSTGKGKELSTRQHFRKCCRTDEKCCRVGDTGNGVESTRSSLQHSNSHANKWKKRAPVWQHQPDVQIETVVCSFDTRSTSTWNFAEKECWLGAISESSPCEKGWISVLLQFFSLGLQVLLLSAQRIENTYSSLPAGGSCNLAVATPNHQSNPPVRGKLWYLSNGGHHCSFRKDSQGVNDKLLFRDLLEDFLTGAQVKKAASAVAALRVCSRSVAFFLWAGPRPS